MVLFVIVLLLQQGTLLYSLAKRSYGPGRTSSKNYCLIYIMIHIYIIYYVAYLLCVCFVVVAINNYYNHYFMLLLNII